MQKHKELLQIIATILVGVLILTVFIYLWKNTARLGAPSTALTYQATLIPLSNNAYDLGTSTQKWRNVYAQDVTISGSCVGCGGSPFPFTPITNYGALTNATNTPIWFQQGLQASSTSYIQSLGISGIGGLGYLDLTQQSAEPSAPAAGTVRIHGETQDTLTFPEFENEAGEMIVMGRDSVFRARNTSGGTITKGQVVYVTGSTGNAPNISLAKADSLTTLASTIGVVAQTSIANNGYGLVKITGVVENFNTSTFTAGDVVFASTSTAGALINIKPIYPYYQKYIGIVLNSGVGNGSLLINTAPFNGGAEVGTTASTYVFGGNVGIGTTPGATLDVNGKIWTVGASSARNANYDLAGNSIGAGTSIYSYGAICTSNNAADCSSTGGTVLGNVNATAINNIPNSGNIILGAGNVGIGTTSPYAKLSIVGEIVSSFFTATSTTATSSLQNTSITGAISLLGEYFTNFTNKVLDIIQTATSVVLTGAWDFGGATSLEIPNSASPTVNAAGEIAVDTTSGQLKWYDGTQVQLITGTSSPAFNIASTTEDAMGINFSVGTSTLLLKNSPEAFTMTGFYCKASTTGTALVRFGDGTNWTEAASCSTGSFTTTATNNTWTRWEDFIVQASSTAGLVDRITITTVLNKTAD